MAEKLEGFLEKLHKEGIDKAEQDKQKIIDEAKKQAESIIKEAKQSSENIISEAEKKAKQSEAKGKEALKQAARDTVISLRASILNEVKNIVSAAVSKSMNSDCITSIVKSMVDAFAKSEFKNTNIELLLSKQDKDNLKSVILADLKNVLISSSEKITSGVVIGTDGSDLKYDITEDAVSEMLCDYLNPKLISILKSEN